MTGMTDIQETTNFVEYKDINKYFNSFVDW